MAHTGFIVPVPQAEGVVADLRKRFDASAALGVPAHITLLFPFMPPGDIDTAVLNGIRDALAGASGFEFTLASTARFPATVYLEPAPAAPFIELTERLARRFPLFPPFGGEFSTIIPHLTVAHGSAPDAVLVQAELMARLAARGPVHGVCDSVVLLENSSGRWQKLQAFALYPLRRAG
jgi:2'-5' RNA ligase